MKARALLPPLEPAVAAHGDLAYAGANLVDHTLTDQSSILRFIEDSWGTGRTGGGSFDVLTGPLTNMFDFGQAFFGHRRLLLDPTTGGPL